MGTRGAIGAVLGSAVLSAAIAGPASASMIVVNTTADEFKSGDGKCSLREAVAAVNSPAAPTDCNAAAFGANTIALGPRRYVLAIPFRSPDDNATGDLNVGGPVKRLTIIGAGERRTSIAANGLSDRVLSIAAGATVALSNLRITGGHAPGGTAGMGGVTDSFGSGTAGGRGGDGGDGGAIHNGGNLKLDYVAVTGSRAGDGGAGGQGGTGAASHPGGLGGNGGNGGWGGAIYNSGRLTIRRTTISGNRAGKGGTGGTGGASELGGGTASGQAGVSGNGGGVANDSGTLNVGTATLSRNVAGGGGRGGHGASTNGATDGSSGSDGGFGGGVFSEGGAISIINSTIVGNTPGDGGIGGTGGNSTSGGRGANGGHGGNSGDGGGISTLFDTGGDSVRSTTVVGNALGSPGLGGPGGNGAGGPGSRGGSGVSGSGAGIADYLSSISLRNTLVASNVGDNCAGSFANKQHNLSFPDATCPGINRDPKLGALRNNGGPTKTIAPGHAGAAIDRVPASGAGCPLTDQRGVGRPGGHACDIGAYEVASPTVGPAHVSGLGNHQAMVSLNVTANQTDATVYLEYGTSTRYAKMTSRERVFGLTPSRVAWLLTGLKSKTKIHFRIVANSFDGTTKTPDHMFKTS